MALLRDSKAVVSAELVRGKTPPSKLRFWDIDSGILLRAFPLNIPNLLNTSLAMSSDGKTVATGSGEAGDSSILLWDTVTGQRRARLQGHASGAITTLAFSPDSRFLASGGRDTTVLLWEVPPGRLEHLWSVLTRGQEELARSIKKLGARPATAVPLLKEYLFRAAELDMRVQGWITDLDHDKFEVREKASQELERVGLRAGFRLRLARQRSSSLEARRRIEAALAKLEELEEKTKESVSDGPLLSLAVLEEVGTPEARGALEELAKAPEQSLVAREAGAALRRLNRQRRVP
jgi:hypothetical protein